MRILVYLELSFRQKAGLSLHESRAPHFSVPPSLSAPLTGSGSPRCTFPFIYKGRSYSPCTTVGRRDRKLWCATTDSYAKDGRWRFCSPMGEAWLPSLLTPFPCPAQQPFLWALTPGTQAHLLQGNIPALNPLARLFSDHSFQLERGVLGNAP